MLCIILLVIQSTSFTFANKFSEVEVVELVDTKDGSTNDYTVVNLLIDGDDVFADVPAILYDLKGKTRTLVPISFITDKIGAGIAWNGEKKQVTIDHNGKTIVLTIDSDKAVVDGVTYDLPNGVPAKLMAYEGIYRTMVPASFVSEHLGYEIFWLGETRTVSINRPQQTLSAVRYDDSGTYPELRFKVTGEVGMTSFSVDGKSVGGEDALVLDFHNTKLDLTNPPKYGKFIINDMIQEIFDIEIIQDSTGPYNTKAIVGLGYYRNGEVRYDKTTGEMVVQLINSVNYVDVEKVNTATSVVIDTTENPAYNVERLSDRIIVDIIHSKLVEDGKTLNINDGGIETVTYSQIDNDDTYDAGTRYARITVKLDDNTSSGNVFVDNAGSKVYIYVQDSVIGTYSYARNIDNATSEFGMNLNSIGSYSVTHNQTNNSISMTIPTSAVDLTVGEDKRDDGVINKITVTENASNETYDILIELSENTIYTAQTNNTKDFKISFANEILKDSIYKDKLIVIDAGHGGHDPGASHASNLEKNIALQASLLLKKKLENAGFKVYMTRERDNYVKLYDRAGIANQLNADLFISVHINAARNTNARGIETLYAPDNARNNKALADAIQSELISATGAVNRGVVSRPELVVIRETEMDAVLVELGFLSNPEDEQKLLTTNYLEACAEAILEGVIDFMD